MTLPRNPIIYEINTWVWLNALSVHADQPITLATVPDAILDELASWHFDAIWLMGVWQRSPQGREIARTQPGLQMEYARALSDYTDADVVGSPYAVNRYEVDLALGGQDGLAAFRKRLAARNLKLILDYVPNHVAVDHPWTQECAACLVAGTEDDLKNRPGYYFRASATADGSNSGLIFAHGRDPYYPGWTDTAQIDAFSETARQHSRDTVLDIAAQCDGVRCDMAMLMVNRVFAKTWGISDLPTDEFWSVIIPPIKAKYPDFAFMAEVYWDMEADLQTLGFDYTYDKRLYDRMRDDGAGSVRDHLLAASGYQQKMVRFVENHDEARALAAFGLEHSQAAAALATLLPGAHLLHDGQLEGRRLKLPVQLGRRPIENPIESLLTFYRALLSEAAQPPYHQGVYMALAANPLSGDSDDPAALIAFAWALSDDWRIVVVNFSGQSIQTRLIIPFPHLSGFTTWEFTDALSGATALHGGADVLTAGLPIALPAYGVQIWRIGQ